MENFIRHDLFAVKEYQDGIWVFVFISSHRWEAENYRSALIGRSFRKPKLVHPSQRIVNAYEAAGNTISI